MLTLAEIIRAPKTNVKIGSWKTGKILGSAFPIAKQRSFPSGSAWSWRVVEFEACWHQFRLLIRLNTDISYYSSIIALEDAGKNQIICHHEMHLSHRNWHCHFINGNVHETFPGVLRDRARMRVYEASPSQADTVEFTVVPKSALAVAAARFRFSAPVEAPAQGVLL